MMLECTVHVTVTEDDLDSIQESANYGCAYWAVKVKNPDYCRDEEGDEHTVFRLRNAIKRGLPIAIAQGFAPLENGRLDCGNIDSERADAIVQLGVFGEVIYG